MSLSMICIKKTLPSILAIIMVALMVFASELFNEIEIIFPEIAALTIGAWLAPKQPWQTDKKRIVILISISSIVGVLIVRYIPAPLFIKALIGFLFTIFLLIISKTTFMPLISACILPIFMNTESIVYPLSVFIMSLIIVLIQDLLQRNNFLPLVLFEPVSYSLKKWLTIFLCFIIVSILPILKNYLFFIAPPLIVMFVELSNPKSPARSKPINIYLQIIFMAFASAIICDIFIFKISFIYSKTIASILVMLILIYTMNINNSFFPPIGAVALLPFIISKEYLMLYPIEIMIGSGILMVLDYIVFPQSYDN